MSLVAALLLSSTAPVQPVAEIAQPHQAQAIASVTILRAERILPAATNGPQRPPLAGTRMERAGDGRIIVLFY